MNRPLLRSEFQLFSRYLVASAPSPELNDLYADAAKRFFSNAPSQRDAVEISFIQRFPFSIRYLDAFDSVFRRGSLLRKKILLALSVLETSTTQVDCFEWKRRTRLGWILHMGSIAFKNAVDVAVGAVLNGLLLVIKNHD
ncbi:MAG: hypothetical protein JWO95_113 [Verrucomicrobiales bacterium]|nr:hypothetical protein [Verrucomicrobiales bacterium]